jgi:hypothetical protein
MPEPDRAVVTARLERFTELVAGAGAVDVGDPGLIRPIRAIAAWVGPIGAPLFAQLAEVRGRVGTAPPDPGRHQLTRPWVVRAGC